MVGLDRSKRLADYDYLVEVMDREYPHFAVMTDQQIAEWEKRRLELRPQAADAVDDAAFYSVITALLSGIFNAHTGVIPPGPRFDSYVEIYTHMEKAGVDTDTIAAYAPWSETFGDQDVAAAYAAWTRVVPSKAQTSSSLTTSHSVCSVKLIPEQAAALITVNTYYPPIDKAGDIPLIHSFLSQVAHTKEYRRIIIDQRGNGGGSTAFWTHAFVEPLANRPLVMETYALYRGGPLVDRFYENRLENRKPLSELPSFPNLPKSVFRYFSYFSHGEKRIEPKDGVGFTGDIILLCDHRNYSSSEGFAQFCKRTGFARIVGERTRGDGIGSDPVLILLPNSKLIATTSAQMGLNIDGSSNEECGTEPDVQTSSGDALETALRLPLPSD